MAIKTANIDLNALICNSRKKPKILFIGWQNSSELSFVDRIYMVYEYFKCYIRLQSFLSEPLILAAEKIQHLNFPNIGTRTYDPSVVKTSLNN